MNISSALDFNGWLFTRYWLYDILKSLMLFLCFFTFQGGVKAVVYSDVLQTLLMIGGVLVVVVICCVNVGLDNIWAAAEHGGRLEVLK